ncbi:MAG TPA: 3-dehydroquinate synthase [Polyangiaceae bacterium]
MTRPLLIGGSMATGKSTVARLLAGRVGRPLVDLDERIVARLGKSIAETFATDGEPHFRRVEREELERILDEALAKSAAPIVALGGGALLPRDLRLRALDEAVVVTLEASPAEIARRAAGSSGRPLLDGPSLERRAAEVSAQRAVAYAEAHARIATDGKSPESVAGAVLEVWRRDAVVVAAGTASYVVEIGVDTLREWLPELARGASSSLLVTDANVSMAHGATAHRALGPLGVPIAEIVLEPGERQKHAGTVELIWRAALGAGADRKSVFVGLGGGVVTDITGFAAATYMRGVAWVGIPTTLLAMVDASVGGKTGVDLDNAKNAVGAFWQPRGVLCDPTLEATEPVRGYVSALAEVVKTALIGDASLLDLLETRVPRVLAREPELVAEIVRRSVRVKARVVGLDERESGPRAMLNLGHTVGHALEAQGGYERLTHGEAVSLGLVAALRIGEKLGQTSPALSERVIGLLGRLGLPTNLTKEPLAQAAEHIGHDKKRAGKRLKFVVARDPGRVEMVDVDLAELRTLAVSLQ